MIGLFVAVAMVIAAYIDVRRLRYQRITRQWMAMDLQRTRVAAKQHSRRSR
jgi:O-phosphoseryl-tRNA(Cys) synthetase